MDQAIDARGAALPDLPRVSYARHIRPSPPTAIARLADLVSNTVVMGDATNRDLA
jgi:hypothetical protein